MIFFHLSSTWFSDLQVTKNCFSADQLIIQKRKLYFSITKPCRYQFEAMVFNQEWLLYCTQSLYRLKVQFLCTYLYFSGNTTIMDIDNEDSMDAPSVSSTDGAATPIIMSTPVSKKVKYKITANYYMNCLMHLNWPKNFRRQRYILVFC